MTAFTDKSLTCITCGTQFVFTAGEQEFHATKGFTNEPRRCLTCRRARRGDQAAAPVYADAPQAAARPRRARSSATATAEAERPSPHATAEGRADFSATCSVCGAATVLPFDPVGNRAVFCRGCYDKVRAFN